MPQSYDIPKMGHLLFEKQAETDIQPHYTHVAGAGLCAAGFLSAYFSGGSSWMS